MEATKSSNLRISVTIIVFICMLYIDSIIEINRMTIPWYTFYKHPDIKLLMGSIFLVSTLVIQMTNGHYLSRLNNRIAKIMIDMLFVLLLYSLFCEIYCFIEWFRLIGYDYISFLPKILLLQLFLLIHRPFKGKLKLKSVDNAPE